jgi:hypothetical protein
MTFESKVGNAVFSLSLSVFIFVRLITVYFSVTEFTVEKTQRNIGDERLPGCKYPTPINLTLSFSLYLSFFRLIATFVSFTGVSSYVVYVVLTKHGCGSRSPPPPAPLSLPTNQPLVRTHTLSLCLSSLALYI